MKLYRAMSEAEFRDLLSTGKFRSPPNTLGVKWFAERLGDAVKWADWFARVDPQVGRHPYIEIEVPDDVADGMFRHPNMDTVGPARAAEPEDLAGVTFREVRP